MAAACRHFVILGYLVVCSEILLKQGLTQASEARRVCPCFGKISSFMGNHKAHDELYLFCGHTEMNTHGEAV